MPIRTLQYADDDEVYYSLNFVFNGVIEIIHNRNKPLDKKGLLRFLYFMCIKAHYLPEFFVKEFMTCHQ